MKAWIRVLHTADAPDDQLIAKLETLSASGRRLDVRVILLLIQVEERRLDRRVACPSLYELCRQKLG